MFMLADGLMFTLAFGTSMQLQTTTTSRMDEEQLSAPMTTPSPLTVCVITYRRPELLTELLKRIGNCVLPSTFQEVVIVDNGGSRETADIVAEAAPHLHARLLRCDSPSKCAALNVALRSIK